MPPEHDAAAAKSIRDQTIRAGLRVTPLNRQHTIGMRQVPQLAARTALETGQHQLRAHGAITDQTPLERGFMQKFFHRPSNFTVVGLAST
jgi:hypothetical protein